LQLFFNYTQGIHTQQTPPTNPPQTLYKPTGVDFVYFQQKGSYMQKKTNKKIEDTKDSSCYYGCPKCKRRVPQVIAQKLTVTTSEVVELQFFQDVEMDGNFYLMTDVAVMNYEKDFSILYICGVCGSPVQRIND
jgi:hypothetical protein